MNADVRWSVKAKNIGRIINEAGDKINSIEGEKS
jgi:hypothetical protein